MNDLKLELIFLEDYLKEIKKGLNDVLYNHSIEYQVYKKEMYQKIKDTEKAIIELEKKIKEK